MLMRKSGLVLLLLVAMGLPFSAQAGEKSSAANARSRMDAAKKYYKGYREALRIDVALKLDFEQFYRWSVRWMEAQSDLNEKKADRIQAVEDHLKRMKELENMANDLVKSRTLTRYEAAAPEFYRLEAEKWLEELKKKWKTHGSEHEEARRFIYKEWPELTTNSMTGKVKEAEKALQVCIKVGDVVGVAKLRKGTDKHIERIEEEYAALKVDVNIDDERQAKALQALIKELRTLDKGISSYLERRGSD